jgi:hypothetical protein
MLRMGGLGNRLTEKIASEIRDPVALYVSTIIIQIAIMWGRPA